MTVKLLCDGETVGEPVTLSRENEWRYTWKGLEAGKDYAVVEEKVPAGYTVSVTREGTAFTVTNRETTPGPTPTPGPTKPPGKPKLPQTGQDWMLVCGLVGGGILLVILGVVARRRTS